MNPVRNILCPIDFSEGSGTALSHALSLAERFDARVELVHAWQIPYTVRPDLMMWVEAGTTRSIYEATRDQAQADMQQQLEAIPAGLRQRVTGRVVAGEPVAALLEILAARAHDLVVMGTHGRTGLQHLLMGSVAERVVRRSPVPVLTLRLPRSAPQPTAQAAAS